MMMMMMMMMMMRMKYRSHHPPQKELFPLLFPQLLLCLILLLLFLQHQVPNQRKRCIVQLLLQQQERSKAAAGELRQLVTQDAEPANNKSAWGSFLHSNVPQIHDRVWPVYLNMELEDYIWALNESDNIRERQQCQQQPGPLIPPHVQLSQSHQLQVTHQIITPLQQQQQQQQQQQHQQQQKQQQQYQLQEATQYAVQVLHVAGPSLLSMNTGASGSLALDNSQNGLSTPRPSLSDIFSAICFKRQQTLCHQVTFWIHHQ